MPITPTSMKEEFMSLGLTRIDDHHLSLTADQISAKDILRMLELSHKVDPSILNTPESDRARLLSIFKSNVAANSNTVIEISPQDLRNLSQVLEGVNIVDPEDYFSGEDLIPSDERMSELTEEVTRLYEQHVHSKPAPGQ